jgi:phytoene synthase
MRRTPRLDLRASYTACARITARHGRSYHLAARLLPPQRRRAVHALYAFARTVDDIVDHPSGSAEDVLRRLEAVETLLRHPERSQDDGASAFADILPALGDTVER